MLIENLSPEHWSSVASIYASGIASGNATFQTQVPEWEQWDQSHTADVRLVAIDEEQVIGWAALSPVSSRPVYAGVAEVSVYVSPIMQGKGTGKLLLKHLIERSEQKGFWTLQAGIFPENIASIKIHEELGFRLVGRREKIGKMKDTWRDTVLLERRSTTIGID